MPKLLRILMTISIFLLLSLLAPVAFAGNERSLSRVLNVYNWEDYLGETTIRDFERRFGVKVHLETYKNEEEMLSAVQSDPAKYDIIIISGLLVQEMRALKLLAPVNCRNIPNIGNIDPMFKNPFYDPGNRYSVPYLWGTTGIAVNRRFVKEKVNSWKILWDFKYRGKISLLNDMDEVIAMALKTKGYSINTNDPRSLEEARLLLLKQRPLIAGYHDCIKTRGDLISGRIWLSHQFSGEACYAADKNKDIEYVIPKEGASIWVDNICIPRDSRNKYTAEVFINYILAPEASAKIANYLWYANCNRAAARYTLKEILEDPAIYPPAQILRRCEFFKEAGTDQEIGKGHAIRNKIWSELMNK
ncbi:MAG: spermidine/putrescine ABC transporter substrate-binding protein [Thermodesulfobacteriota bacterium]|nr:spermidine/putrescine ABC transporter substrate-binding protein [Thermodesulfobacteriota bacterium]